MSNTDRFQKAPIKRTRSQLEQMAQKADAILDDVQEKEFNIIYAARMIVEYFQIPEMQEEMDDAERITIAAELTRRELEANHHPTVSWQRHCAKRMAAKALDFADKIINKRMSHSKAVRQIDEIIAQRNHEHVRRQERQNEKTPNNRRFIEFSVPSHKPRPHKRKHTGRKAA